MRSLTNVALVVAGLSALAEPASAQTTAEEPAAGEARATREQGASGEERATDDAQPNVDRQADATARAVARALDARLTVWRNPRGRVIHARHCRQMRGGCRARIAALASLITEVARAHRIDPFLLAAMAIRESGLNPFAEGSVGERGLIQLHPKGAGSHVRFVRSEAYRRACKNKPDSCQREVLEAGARLLAQSMRRCGTVVESLGAYNRGVCGETAYSRRVMEERGRLISLAKRGPTPTPTMVD